MWIVLDRIISSLFLAFLLGRSGVSGQQQDGMNINITNTTTTATNVTMASDTSDCVSSTSEIMAALATERLNTTEILIVTICPNTRIEHQPPDGVSFAPSLRILAPNTHIRCGANGESSDNCTLANNNATPELATLLLLQIGQGLPSFDNVFVSGVTFDGGATGAVAVSLVYSGYVEFRDCIFKNYRAIQHGVIGLLYNGEGKTSVVFDSCRFENNAVSSYDSTNSVALVWMYSKEQSAVFQNTTFQNNDFQTWAVKTSALESETSLVVQDCCFINNTFNAPILVVAKERDVGLVANNYVDSRHCERCTFFQVGLNDTNNCMEANLTTCSFDKTLGTSLTQAQDCGAATSAALQNPCAYGLVRLYFVVVVLLLSIA